MKSRILFTLLAAVSMGGNAMLLEVDQAKDKCKFGGSDNGDLVVTCPASSNPRMTETATGSFRIEMTQLNGAPARRFVILVAGDQPVTTTAVAEGWSITTSAARSPVANAGAAPKPADAKPEPVPQSVAQPTPQVMPPSAKPVAAPVKKEAASEANPVDRAVAKQKDVQFDYSIPDMPAFTVLGMSPENVQHPRTARSLAVALKDGLDENGKLKTGLALEFQPFRLGNPTAVLKSYLPQPGERTEYRMNTMQQMLANASVSLATAQGSGDSDKSRRLGVGLRIPIFDKSDGRTDEGLRKCYQAAKTEYYDKSPPVGARLSGDDLAKLDELENSMIERAAGCFRQTRAPETAFWNASAWIVSLGGGWTSDSGSFSDSKTATRGIWTTYAYGFDDFPMLANAAQVIFHLRALDKERVANPNETGKFLNQDSRAAAIGFKYGVPTFNVSLQGSYHRLKLEGIAAQDKVRRFTLGLEYKLADDLWLVASVGSENGRVNGENNNIVTTSFRYQPGVSKAGGGGP